MDCFHGVLDIRRTISTVFCLFRFVARTLLYRECGKAFASGSNIRRSTKVAPGFRYAGQWVLLMVTTRSYMASPPDAVAAFPSAEAVVGAVGQIEIHGVASRITFKVVEDQARMFQHGLDLGL